MTATNQAIRPIEPITTTAAEARELLAQRFTQPGYENWRIINGVHVRFSPSCTQPGRRNRELLWEGNSTWFYVRETI